MLELIAQIPHLMQHGFGLVDAAMLVVRLVLGTSFTLMGYFKLFNETRHKTFVETLEYCGIPHIWFFQWFVPAVEFIGGILVLFGIWGPVGAGGMIVILLVALCTDGPRRIRELQPLNGWDAFSCLLYLSEFEYMAMAIIVIIIGPGAYTLPALFF